jgi:hypothetical protein
MPGGAPPTAQTGNMPKLAADQAHADDTAAQLHKHAGLQHLRVRKHGAAIVIESGPKDDPVRHARVVRDSATLWDLEIADHRGRWEYSGMRATRSDLVDALVQDFGWVLTDIVGENPERTSDPKY